VFQKHSNIKAYRSPFFNLTVLPTTTSVAIAPLSPMLLEISPNEAVPGQQLVLTCSYPPETALTSVNFQMKSSLDSNFDPVYSITFNNSNCTGIKVEKPGNIDATITTNCSCDNSGTVLRWIVQSVPKKWHKHVVKCTDNYDYLEESEAKELIIEGKQIHFLYFETSIVFKIYL